MPLQADTFLGSQETLRDLRPRRVGAGAAGVITALVGDHIELYQQCEDNPSFKQWLSEVVFQATYQPPARG